MARVECTTNDASFFKIHRWVEQRDGWQQWKLAPLRKNIYSLRDLRKLMNAANERYLAYMAAIVLGAPARVSFSVIPPFSAYCGV